MKKNITANIITLNEEKNIEAVIKSVQEVCDEVLVIDSLSSDRTCEIAESLGAKVIKQAYLGDGPQKAFGAPFAKNEWILSIDADERLDANAIEAIKNLDLNATSYEAFSFARKTYVGKAFIKLWYPDRVTRLYNKSKCGFSTAGGHARVQTQKVKDLDADMLHYSYEDYAQMVKTSHKFITRGAKIAHEEGKRASAFDPFLHGVGALFKALILKGGAFHGVNGWNVAVISAFSSYMKYALMLEMQEND
ncbi:MAG: glycosyltransferase family 2 protein [Sulfurimonas sp.]|jgi:glycosyltransferase involved in cell wall biosynthesis|nr:glycosyltransferase family 2 protein [Sulfurimonas sp.]MBU1217813.1 glycosyltransferase family 2 protein [bacterium]MBU1433388.1 glycosyltransferase family 2 protein [bacterium]MBU1503416.1 glycosyltransferase family 2 protein [bacterium]MBU3940032.1 glycosyltransferase family 2 protein [bacterium]